MNGIFKHIKLIETKQDLAEGGANKCDRVTGLRGGKEESSDGLPHTKTFMSLDSKA
jgi:hypothetical protein